MASRNVVCFLGIRKLMKANTEQLACWRRSDSRARRSDGRGELHCTPGKRGGEGGGGTRGECESGYCLNAWKRRFDLQNFWLIYPYVHVFQIYSYLYCNVT